MARFHRVEESARFAAVPRGGAGLALRNRDRGDLGSVHFLEEHKVAVGIDNRYCEFPVVFLGFGGCCGGRLHRAFQRDRRPVGNVERHLFGNRSRSRGGRSLSWSLRRDQGGATDKQRGEQQFLRINFLPMYLVSRFSAAAGG